MVRPGRDRLSGEIEVDETYIGGLGDDVRHDYISKKPLVIIAAEIRGRATGRIRLRRIPDRSIRTIQSFVSDSIAPGSTLVTDGLQAYRSLSPEYGLRRLVIRRFNSDLEAVLPRVHRVASLIKRWLGGTHQGRVERSHLPYYLDEFAFRFNRRNSRYRGLLFHRLMQQAVVANPAPFKTLVGGANDNGPQ
jgi:hypothetical protein